jgi:hypothetical protein
MEARAAAVYWKLWRDVPIRFARRNPHRLGPNGRWRPGRSELWLTFGPRASILTEGPFRATTPGNALLNYLYAVLESEMTVALLAVGLDPGIGMFHSDIDGRSSLALDAIEAVRPNVDYWLVGYLASSAFANRDFTELSDGEVRLTHPLGSHLAHTAALWRKVCEPVASWLAQCFSRAAGSNFNNSASTSITCCAIRIDQHTHPHRFTTATRADGFKKRLSERYRYIMAHSASSRSCRLLWTAMQPHPSRNQPRSLGRARADFAASETIP